MTAREILQSYPLDTCQKVKYDKGKGESEMTQQAAFQFLASINLNMCRLYKDFGKGFYLSSGKIVQAEI